MGWVFVERRPADTVAWLKEELFGSGRCEVRAAETVGTTVYMAVRVKEVDEYLAARYVPDADGSVTAGIVVLVNGNGYKDMDEGMGPREARASAAILDLLSELKPNAEYALAWRHRCREARR